MTSFVTAALMWAGIVVLVLMIAAAVGLVLTAAWMWAAHKAIR